MRSLVVVLAGLIILSFCAFNGYAQEKQDVTTGQQQAAPAPAPLRQPRPRPRRRSGT